jgi:hypothetical protein
MSGGDIVHGHQVERSTNDNMNDSDNLNNPNDPHHVKVCYVCQEPAKPDQPHTPHYGGIACLSCRAFFRRAHQGGTYPQFVCKYNGRCVVTVKNRRRCQKCRYVRCLQTGMTAEGVLSENQKKIRFRKLILKRKHSGEPLPKFVANCTDRLDEEDSDEGQSKVEVAAKKQQKKQPEISGSPLSKYQIIIIKIIYPVYKWNYFRTEVISRFIVKTKVRKLYLNEFQVFFIFRCSTIFLFISISKNLSNPNDANHPKRQGRRHPVKRNNGSNVIVIREPNVDRSLPKLSDGSCTKSDSESAL